MATELKPLKLISATVYLPNYVITFTLQGLTNEGVTVEFIKERLIGDKPALIVTFSNGNVVQYYNTPFSSLYEDPNGFFKS